LRTLNGPGDEETACLPKLAWERDLELAPDPLVLRRASVRGAVPKVHLGASYRNRPARVHPAARSAAPAGEAERRRPTSQTGPRVGVLALRVDPQRPIHRCRPLNIRNKKRQSALPKPGSSSLRSKDRPALGSSCPPHPGSPRPLARHVEVLLDCPFGQATFPRSAWTCSRAERSPGRRREPRSRRRDLPGLATPALLSSPVLHMRPAFVPEGGRAARPSPPGALRAALTARPFLPRVLGLPS